MAVTAQYVSGLFKHVPTQGILCLMPISTGKRADTNGLLPHCAAYVVDGIAFWAAGSQG